MRAARFLLALAAATALTALGARVVPGFSRVVDLFLVLTVLQGLRGSSLAGLAGGLAAGLTHDTLTGGPFGLYGFADTLVGYSTARLSQRLVVQRAFGVALVVGAFSLVQRLLLIVVHLMAAPPVPWPDPTWMLLRAVVCGLLGGMLVWLGALWQRGRAARSRHRSRRLRMD